MILEEDQTIAAPAVHISRPQTLRVLCTEITPFRQLQARAQRDLGFELAFEQHDFVTAQRLVNAVPAVVDAPPGLVTALDLPLVTGRGLVSTEAGS